MEERNKPWTLMEKIGFTIPFFMVGSFAFQIGVNAWRNSHIRQLGEGYNVREIGDERLFYLGNGRFCLDNNHDGVPDATFVQGVIGPLQGGPGYIPIRVKTNDDDYKRLSRANYLLSMAPEEK